jgi:hypothetical protein
MWLTFVGKLYKMTAQQAADTIGAMSDDDVLSFSSWDDAEARIGIRAAKNDADELHDIANGLRDALLRSTIAEIEFRANN